MLAKRRFPFARTLALATSLTVVIGLCAGAATSSAGTGIVYYDAKSNVAAGAGLLFNGSVIGGYNVGLGYDVMPKLNGGTFNTSIGFDALDRDTNGNSNTATAYFALANNTLGDNNTATGYAALGYNQTGSNNVANGYNALLNSKASDNVAVGNSSLLANISGYENVASGNQTLNANTTGIRNQADGFQALYKNTTGRNNVASGWHSLYKSTGSFNTALGFNSGANLTNGSNNLDIANVGVAGESATARIGTEGTQTQAYVAGITGTSIPGPAQAVLVNGNGQLGTATASSKALKTEITPLADQAAKVLKLQPVSYHYKQGDQSTQYGLIAEQVARQIPELVQFDAAGTPTGVHYEQLPALLLAQVQRQQKEIKARDARVDHLQAQVNWLIHHR
jgi:hypothetical protein